MNRRRRHCAGVDEDEHHARGEDPPRLAVGQRRADRPEELRHHRTPVPGPPRRARHAPTAARGGRVEPARGLEGLACEPRLPLLELPAPEDRRREREVGDPPDLIFCAT